MQEKIIITCTLKGVGPLSKNRAQLISLRQIADSGMKAAEAGVDIPHVHVRNPLNGEFSGIFALYEEVVGLIREKNRNVILNPTTVLCSGFYPSDPLLPDTTGLGTHWRVCVKWVCVPSSRGGSWQADPRLFLSKSSSILSRSISLYSRSGALGLPLVEGHV
jgi:hypothetical protein